MWLTKHPAESVHYTTSGLHAIFIIARVCAYSFVFRAATNFIKLNHLIEYTYHQTGCVMGTNHIIAEQACIFIYVAHT